MAGWVRDSVFYDLPYEFKQGTAVLYNDEIHIIGGSAHPRNHYKLSGSTWEAIDTSVFGYNNVEDLEMADSDGQYHLEKCRSVIFDNKIYLMAPYDYEERTYPRWLKSLFFAYDGITWSELDSCSHWFPAGIVVFIDKDGNDILFGIIEDGEPFSYRPRDNDWGVSNSTLGSYMDDIPEQFLDNTYGMEMVVLNNEVHFFNGTKHLKWRWIANHNPDREGKIPWIELEDAPYRVDRAFVDGDRIYLVQSVHESSSGTEEKPMLTVWNEELGYTSSEMPVNFLDGSIVKDAIGRVRFAGGAEEPYSMKIFEPATVRKDWAQTTTPGQRIGRGVSAGGFAIDVDDILYVVAYEQGSFRFYKFNDSIGTYEEISNIINTVNGLYDGSTYTGCSIISFNHQIHILGGSSSASNAVQRTHMAYTPGSTQLPVSFERVSTIPYNFSGGAAVVYHGEIHIIGGSAYPKRHYKWNGSKWTSVATLPIDFVGGSVIVDEDDTIHLFMGTDHYTYYASSASVTGSWSNARVVDVPYEFKYGSAVIYDGKVCLLGGEKSASGSSPDNQANDYFISSSSADWDWQYWISKGTLPYLFATGYAVVHRDKLHIFGGHTSTYWNNHFMIDTVVEGTNQWEDKSGVYDLPIIRGFFKKKKGIEKVDGRWRNVYGNKAIKNAWIGDRNGKAKKILKQFVAWDASTSLYCHVDPANDPSGLYNSAVTSDGSNAIYQVYKGSEGYGSYFGIAKITDTERELVVQKGDVDSELKYPFIALYYNEKVHILGNSYGSASKKAVHAVWDGETYYFANSYKAGTLPFSKIFKACVHNDHLVATGIEPESRSNGYEEKVCLYQMNNNEHGWTKLTELPITNGTEEGPIASYKGNVHYIHLGSHFKWDGKSWISVGRAPSSIEQLVVYHNLLYGFVASGKFYYYFDGTNWIEEEGQLPYTFNSKTGYGSVFVHKDEIHIAQCTTDNPGDIIYKSNLSEHLLVHGESIKRTAPPLREIYISGPKEIYEGESVTYTIRLRPSTAEYTSINWRVNDENLATIASKDGLSVTLNVLSSGDLKLYATVTSSSSFDTSLDITIKPTEIYLVDEYGQEVSGLTTIYSDTDYTYRLKVRPSSIPINSVDWSTNGLITPTLTKNGEEVTIRTSAGGSFNLLYQVSYGNPDSSYMSMGSYMFQSEKKITNISISGSSSITNDGITPTYSVSLTPSNATITNLPVWSVSNNSIAHIVGYNYNRTSCDLEIIKSGSIRITCTIVTGYGTFTAYKDVTVTYVGPADSITLNEDDLAMLKLTEIVFYKDSSYLADDAIYGHVNGDSKPSVLITATSDDGQVEFHKVANDDTGYSSIEADVYGEGSIWTFSTNIRGLKAGDVTITASTHPTDTTTIQASATIPVVEVTDALLISSDGHSRATAVPSLTVSRSGNAGLERSLYGTGAATGASYRDVTYTNSNPSVCTVKVGDPYEWRSPIDSPIADVTITLKGNGTTKITFSAKGCSCVVNLTVTDYVAPSSGGSGNSGGGLTEDDEEEYYGG